MNACTKSNMKSHVDQEGIVKGAFRWSQECVENVKGSAKNMVSETVATFRHEKVEVKKWARAAVSVGSFVAQELLARQAVKLYKDARSVFEGIRGVGDKVLETVKRKEDLADSRLTGFVNSLEFYQNSKDTPRARFILSPVINITEAFSTDVHKAREACRKEIRETIIASSEEFGKFIMSFLVEVFVSASNEKGEINWPEAEAIIKEAYVAHAEAVAGHYELLNYSGHIAKEAQKIKDLIDQNGTVRDRSALLWAVKQSRAQPISSVLNKRSSVPCKW